jgi:putative peptide zinc metalloprotease protein
VAWRVADAAEMPVLGFAAAALLLGAMLAPPARGTVQVLANPVARGRWRWGRASGLGILLVALVVGVAMWPIRYRVACPVRVELAQGIDVAATQAGELEWAIAPGTAVQAGAPVARLMSREFALELQTSQAAVDAARLRVAQIEKLRPHDPQAAAELPRAQQQLQAAEQLFGQLKQQAERLVLVAPTAGRAIEPADRPARESAANLAHWSGTPLDNENRGAWIAVGDVVATIATTQHRELRLGIAERHVSRVEPGQRVRAQLSAWPGHVVEGRVVSIAQVGGDPSDARQWQTAWLDSLSEQIRYEAKIAIDEPLARVPIASGGRAKIEVGRTTVGATLARWWRELFAID